MESRNKCGPMLSPADRLVQTTNRELHGCKTQCRGRASRKFFFTVVRLNQCWTGRPIRWGLFPVAAGCVGSPSTGLATPSPPNPGYSTHNEAAGMLITPPVLRCEHPVCNTSYGAAKTAHGVITETDPGRDRRYDSMITLLFGKPTVE